MPICGPAIGTITFFTQVPQIRVWAQRYLDGILYTNKAADSVCIHVYVIGAYTRLFTKLYKMCGKYIPLINLKNIAILRKGCRF